MSTTPPRTTATPAIISPKFEVSEPVDDVFSLLFQLQKSTKGRTRGSRQGEHTTSDGRQGTEVQNAFETATGTRAGQLVRPLNNSPCRLQDKTRILQRRHARHAERRVQARRVRLPLHGTVSTPYHLSLVLFPELRRSPWSPICQRW